MQPALLQSPPSALSFLNQHLLGLLSLNLSSLLLRGLGLERLSEGSLEGIRDGNVRLDGLLGEVGGGERKTSGAGLGDGEGKEGLGRELVGGAVRVKRGR